MNPRAREGFAKALEGHPFVTVEDLEEQERLGRAFVWSGEPGDVFVRITDGVCEMGPVAGDADELIAQALPQIEAWARQNNCTQMHAQAGRQGWEPKLKPHGYSVAAVIFRKDL